MADTLFSLLRVFAALLLVGLNGLFVTAEFTFTRLREQRVESMVQEGKPFANLVRIATDNLDTYLAVCQVGITIASLGLGALGEPAVASLVRPLLGSFLPESYIHLVAFIIGFGIITFLHVTYGELVSKSIAIANPEGSSQFVAAPMRFFFYLFRPIVWVTNGLANASARLINIPPPSGTEEEYSEEELHMMVSQSREQGYLEAREEARVRAAFELDEKAVREIMVPRPELVTFPAQTELDELCRLAAEGRDVRYPIAEDESADRIIDTVHVKDLLRVAGGQGTEATAGDLMRGVLTVPESKQVDEVLRNLQESKLRMAVIVNEWGTFEGLVTIKDIMEEIVGEIRDEFEEAGPRVRVLGEGSHAMDGGAPLREVNESLASGFHSEEFDTIGGLVLEELGRAPEVGDEVAVDGD